jgi:hypothetical protein
VPTSRRVERHQLGRLFTAAQERCTTRQPVWCPWGTKPAAPSLTHSAGHRSAQVRHRCARAHAPHAAPGRIVASTTVNGSAAVKRSRALDTDARNVWPGWSLRGRSDVSDGERMHRDGAGKPSRGPAARKVKNVDLMPCTSADARRQVRTRDVWTRRSLDPAWIPRVNCPLRTLNPRVRGSSPWRRTRDQGSDLELPSGSEPSSCPWWTVVCSSCAREPTDDFGTRRTGRNARDGGRVGGVPSRAYRFTVAGRKVARLAGPPSGAHRPGRERPNGFYQCGRRQGLPLRHHAQRHQALHGVVEPAERPALQLLWRHSSRFREGTADSEATATSDCRRRSSGDVEACLQRRCRREPSTVPPGRTSTSQTRARHA